MIKAVFFDVGETLIDESRDWNEWADHLEVPRRVFHALLGAVIARGQHHRRVFDLVRPGVDFAASCREREARRKHLCGDRERSLPRRRAVPETTARNRRAGRHGSSVLAARPMGDHSVRFRAVRVSRARDRQPFRASGVTVRKFGDITTSRQLAIPAQTRRRPNPHPACRFRPRPLIPWPILSPGGPNMTMETGSHGIRMGHLAARSWPVLPYRPRGAPHSPPDLEHRP